MSDKKHSLGHAIVGGTLSAVILAFATFLLFNQQYVKDQISVWSYTPSATVQDLEKNIDFTSKGVFYFYAEQPSVEGSEAFNKDCQRQEVGNPILGCYLANRIYIYDVTNTQLNGIEEVTAAHETLHAVWDRMSDVDRSRVGALLEAQYATMGSDTDLTLRMDYYKRTEPGQFDNELHSILGTETANLSPQLEAHYKEYFNDRQRIVDYHTKYAAIFTNLRNQSDALYAELKTLGASIDSRSTQYDADVRRLSADISQFNDRASKGDFSSRSQFNSERAALVQRSNSLDAERASISTDIDTYNAKYEQYQQVSSAIEALNKSIDSIKDLQPAPSV